MTSQIGHNLELASALLKQGKLVAFVTETVYGLGGHALDETAVAGIFAAKQRPTFDPLIVHVASLSQVEELVVFIPPLARKLASQFWPGPMTLLLEKKSHVPDLVTAGLNEVAIRIPSHPLTRELLQKADIPIAAPSANLFGQISPTTAQHVFDQLGNRIDYILDGGPCNIGVESTVLRVTDNNIELLRYGGLTQEIIEEFTGLPVTISIQHLDQIASASPGQLHKHYAPRTPLKLIEYSQLENHLKQFLSEEKKIGIITFHEPVTLHPQIIHRQLSSKGDLIEAASKLFSTMRELDQSSVDQIICTKMPDTGLGRAINDRLQRASVK